MGENLLNVDDEEKYIVRGNKKIYLYNIKGKTLKEIDIYIDIYTWLKISNSEYIYGGEKSQIIGLQYLVDKHSKEIISLVETYNGNFISRGFDKILVINLNEIT